MRRLPLLPPEWVVLYFEAEQLRKAGKDEEADAKEREADEVKRKDFEAQKLKKLGFKKRLTYKEGNYRTKGNRTWMLRGSGGKP